MRIIMDLDTGLRIVSIDAETLAVAAQCRGIDGIGVPMKLASLLMIATDCGVRSIRIECDRPAWRPVQSAIDELASRNPLIAIVPGRGATDEIEGLIGSAHGFACRRVSAGVFRFEVDAPEIPSNADRASRFAYILSSELGLTSGAAFEIFLAMHELLRNAVERAGRAHPRFELRLEAAGDAIALSASDRGTETGMESSDAAPLAKSIIHRDAVCAHVRRDACFGAGKLQLLDDGSKRVCLVGCLDFRGASVMENLLARFVESRQMLVRLDFASVRFISSSGLGILIAMVSVLRETGGDVVFERVRPKVRSIFRLFNLEEYFTIKDMVETGAVSG
jgi:anti-anti-sigma factor